MTIAVIYGSSRPRGNTEMLTERAVEGMHVERFYLKDAHILPIEDKRHTDSGFSKVEDDYSILIQHIFMCDTIIFATPIYWYGMSGLMKTFIDRWSQTLRDPQFPDFKKRMAEKKIYVIAVGGDMPRVKGLPLIQQFAYIFGFLGMRFDGYILGEGNKPGDIVQDKEAIFAADQLNETLKR